LCSCTHPDREKVTYQREGSRTESSFADTNHYSEEKEGPKVVSKSSKTGKKAPYSESNSDKVFPGEFICKSAEWNTKKSIKDNKGCGAEEGKLKIGEVQLLLYRLKKGSMGMLTHSPPTYRFAPRRKFPDYEDELK